MTIFDINGIKASNRLSIEEKRQLSKLFLTEKALY
jgi:hypothetical protein